jgi:hypothetical protein
MIILEDYISHAFSSTTDVRASDFPTFMMNSCLYKGYYGLGKLYVQKRLVL